MSQDEKCRCCGEVHPPDLVAVGGEDEDSGKPFVDLYQELVDAGAEIANWQADLYVKATPEAAKIVFASGWNYTEFRDGKGDKWLEVPFGFHPWLTREGK